MRTTTFINKNSFLIFYLGVALLYAVIFLGAEFAGSPVSGFRGVAVLGAQWALLSFSAASIIGLLTINRYVFCAFFPILTLLSAIAAYFRLTLGMSLTPASIELAMQNNMATWLTVISWKLVFWCVVSLAASVWLSILRLTRVSEPRHKWVWVFCFILLTFLSLNIERVKQPLISRMPFSFYYSITDYINNRKTASQVRTTFDKTVASTDNDSLTVLFVIGESLRADHLPANGYRRATTPHLSADTSVVYFPDMRSRFGFTFESVPHIMTMRDSVNPDYAFEEQSFISLFKKAGFQTAWISNQDQCGTYVYFMHEADTLAMANSSTSLYSFNKWLDSDLFPIIDNYLSSPKPLKLAVVHSIGSHWWYKSHYSDEEAVFQPEIDSRIVSELSREQMVNSYDNTIIATDNFISGLIEKVADSNAVIIFISDHGEALGEDGHYLHAEFYAHVDNPASFVWYSDIYAKKNPDKIRALKVNATKGWETTDMFHTALDAAGISTSVLDKGSSLFSTEEIEHLSQKDNSL